MSKNLKILFVEDEVELHDIVKAYFEREGFDIVSAYDADGALRIINDAREELNAIILDLMLPGLSGLEILKVVRKKSNIPVIILTAMGDEVDKLLGLELGADDYVVKPFSPRELVARTKAVLRRFMPAETKETRYIIGDFEIDKEAAAVYYKGREVPFTASELKIIFKLAEMPARVFSRSELVRVVSDEYEVDERVIDAHIKNIRKKLASSEAPDLIETVRGFGYRISRSAKSKDD